MSMDPAAVDDPYGVGFSSFRPADPEPKSSARFAPAAAIFAGAGARPLRSGQARSKRSAFITLPHAATKSCTNFSRESSLAYASAMARSWAFEPKTRSTEVPVHL